VIQSARRPETAAGYDRAVVDQAWRLAALLDRNPHSRTRGSFSRVHWAWKFSDFPYPRFQEGVYALARLHDLDVPDNPLFQAPAVRQWVGWALEYWTSLQHGNGAYDEAYPFEQCVAATAFTGFYVGHAFARAQDWLDAPLRGRVKAALVNAGDWLCANDETHGVLSNHLAAAAASLECTAQLFDVPRLSARAEYFRDRILQHQSREGWMSEYGGADAGYGSLTVFYLASYWQRSGCRTTRDALVRFADFLQYFVHPDGTVGGEYASRDTEFYYPAGFEMLAAESPSAAAIASRMRHAIARRQVCGVWSMDEFNFMPMLNNLCFAGDAASHLSGGELPSDRAPFRRWFSDAGLWVVNERAYYAIAGASKGGTVSVFDKASSRLAARHAGLVAIVNGETFTSQDFRISPPAEVSADGNSLKMRVPWRSLKTKVMTSPLFLAFRAFTLTAGRVPAISRWVKDVLVGALITNKQRPRVEHERTLRVLPDGIGIVDELTLPWDRGVVRAVEQFTSIHMGSSLYVDARMAALDGEAASWPVKPRLTLRASLTTAGASWSVDDN